MPTVKYGLLVPTDEEKERMKAEELERRKTIKQRAPRWFTSPLTPPQPATQGRTRGGVSVPAITESKMLSPTDLDTGGVMGPRTRGRSPIPVTGAPAAGIPPAGVSSGITGPGMPPRVMSPELRSGLVNPDLPMRPNAAQSQRWGQTGMAPGVQGGLANQDLPMRQPVDITRTGMTPTPLVAPGAAGLADRQGTARTPIPTDRMARMRQSNIGQFFAQGPAGTMSGVTGYRNEPYADEKGIVPGVPPVILGEGINLGARETTPPVTVGGLVGPQGERFGNVAPSLAGQAAAQRQKFNAMGMTNEVRRGLIQQGEETAAQQARIAERQAANDLARRETLGSAEKVAGIQGQAEIEKSRLLGETQREVRGSQEAALDAQQRKAIIDSHPETARLLGEQLDAAIAANDADAQARIREQMRIQQSAYESALKPPVNPRGTAQSPGATPRTTRDDFIKKFKAKNNGRAPTGDELVQARKEGYFA